MHTEKLSQKRRKDMAKDKYIARVPATEEGEDFIKAFKKFVNKDTYSVRKRFSGKAAPGGAHVREIDAKSIRLYLDEDSTNYYNNFYANDKLQKEVEDLRVKNKNLTANANKQLKSLKIYEIQLALFFQVLKHSSKYGSFAAIVHAVGELGADNLEVFLNQIEKDIARMEKDGDIDLSSLGSN